MNFPRLGKKRKKDHSKKFIEHRSVRFDTKCYKRKKMFRRQNNWNGLGLEPEGPGLMNARSKLGQYQKGPRQKHL